MNIKKAFLQMVTFAAIAFTLSVPLFGQAEPTRSQFSLYGMHFIRGGQTVGIIIQNPRISAGEIIPCVRVRVVFDIYEDVGIANKLRFARRVSREVELDPGEAATFDYAAGRNGDWVSPMVFATPEEGETGPVRLLSTATVRQFGITTFNLPIVEKGFDPQPDPPR